jgi:hypothetical protein
VTRAAGGRSSRRRLSSAMTWRAGVPVALVAVLGAGAELSSGCWRSAPAIVDFAPPARQYKSSEYHDVYELWTRHVKIEHEVDVALEVWATYKSQEFREAFVAHYADAFAKTDEARESLRHAEREAGVAAYEFVVTAQSGNYKWNDLEKKSTPWRVLLLDGEGHELTADQITVERYPDLFEREFYPVKTPFSKTYLIRFLRGAAHEDGFTGERSGQLTLRFAGPFGRGDLRWSVRP